MFAGIILCLGRSVDCMVVRVLLDPGRNPLRLLEEIETYPLGLAGVFRGLGPGGAAVGRGQGARPEFSRPRHGVTPRRSAGVERQADE